MAAQDLVYRARIARHYRMALYCYATPFGFLALSFVFSFFISFFLFGLSVFGVIGIGYTISGLKQAFDNNDYEKKDIGYANLLLGILIMIAGLLIAAFAYLRVN